MTLNLSVPEHDDLKPRITVFGVGGAGGNAGDNMIQKQLDGVDFVVANTDAQALQQSQSTVRVQLGAKVTEGLGAGARPAVGAAIVGARGHSRVGATVECATFKLSTALLQECAAAADAARRTEFIHRSASASTTWA